MDQSRAINALAPFLALAKSATSPRAAADLVTQATSAPNAYVFAELLQHPNIQALASSEQHASSLRVLQCFAWGTWESYQAATPPLPALSDAQALKLRLLTLLTLAAETPQPALSYSALCRRLDLAAPVDLEHLVTTAIYSDLLTATLDPAAQTVVITSVAPLRDLAPGSVPGLVSALDVWGARCAAALAQLEGEIARVKADAEKKARREKHAAKQVRAALEHGGGDKGGPLRERGSGQNPRGGGAAAGKRDQAADDQEQEDDRMDVDASSNTTGPGGKKRTGGAAANKNRRGAPR